jgi:flagellar basal-body rod protein FlgB
MIDALFNDSGYLAAKKSLDVIALRQEAISNNLANLETPGYRRVDVAQSFQNELQRACASGDGQQIANLKPTLAIDSSAVPNSKDGNTVNFENEMLQMNQNTTAHALETQLVSHQLMRMRLAITGKA